MTPVTTDGVVTQMSVPVSAPVVDSAAGPLAPEAGGASAVISSQVALDYPAPVTYYGYSAFPDPREAMDPGALRRSRRSHRHHNQHHRSRRWSPSPWTDSESSWAEAELSSPSIGSTNFRRKHRRRRPRNRHDLESEYMAYNIRLGASPGILVVTCPSVRKLTNM
jgi:hypothetical protein